MNRLTCALAFLALGACIPSALNPGDKVTVTGKALNQDKSAIANTQLTLERSGNSACLFLGSFQSPKTDANGAYTLNLTGADTQNGDTARCFRLSTPAGSKGAIASVDFLMQVTDVQVPDLQVWNGTLTPTQTADGAQLDFGDLSQSHGFNNLSFAVTVKGADGVAWVKNGATSPIAFSDAVLEDFTATATASADHAVKGSGTTFTQHYTSDGVALPSRNVVPASRGAHCDYPSAPATCPLTDGKLASTALGTANAPVSQVVITLAAAKNLKKAVLRGASFTSAAAMVLEGSTDGTTFTKLTDVAPSGGYQELTLTGASGVTKVRLSGTATSGGTLAISALDELSLFE